MYFKKNSLFALIIVLSFWGCKKSNCPYDCEFSKKDKSLAAILMGQWELTKIEIDGNDSSIYLYQPQYKLINRLNFFDCLYNQNNNQYGYYFGFKRNEDSDYSNNIPMMPLPSHYKIPRIGSKKIKYYAYYYFYASLIDSENALWINAKLKDVTLETDLDTLTYKFYYQPKALEHYGGLNLYGGKFYINQISNKEITLTHSHFGSTYTYTYRKFSDKPSVIKAKKKK